MTRLTPLEVATGIVCGVARRPPRLRWSRSPSEALEAAVRPALERGRCFVSFSGGRDSSAVLASAARVARSEGLDEPVPVTIRAADAPDSHEAEWQELVLGHLGLGDWIRLEIGDELDAVGPYARRVLERHGLLWPFNAHFHLPMLECAAGGTLLTGVGGDELWAASSAPRIGLRRRVLRSAPHPLRRMVLARREPIEYPWLRPAALDAAKRAAGSDSAAEPSNVRARMRWWRGMRSTAVGTAALDLIAGDAGAEIRHPLLDHDLWGAVAVAAPPAGFGDRQAALRLAAGRLLPSDVVSRRTKAGFDGVFFRDDARALARAWVGGGVPDELVDPAALRAHWRAGEPDPHSFTLLQAAWLASAGDRMEQPLSRGVQ